MTRDDPSPTDAPAPTPEAPAPAIPFPSPGGPWGPITEVFIDLGAEDAAPPDPQVRTSGTVMPPSTNP